MLPLCQSEGIGVIPWSPLARGLLAGTRKSLEDLESTTRAGSDGFAQHLYDQPSDWEVAQAVVELATERGVKPAQIALAWLISHPAVTAPIIGATKLSHLDDAIAAVDVELSDEEIARIEAPYVAHEVRGHAPPRGRAS